MASGMIESNKGIFCFSSRAWLMSNVGSAKHDTAAALLVLSDVTCVIFLFFFFLFLREVERSSYSSTERYRG
jgi:hypothetical protein